MRAFGLGIGGAVLLSACVPPPSAARVKAFQPLSAVRQAALPQPDFRGYRMAASFLEKSSFRAGAPLRTGALVGGLRVRTDASGLTLADNIAEPALLGGVELPEQLRGGLLFWSATSLYTADVFLGLLKPLLDIGYQPKLASFGPTFVLLHGDAGQRTAVDLRSRQRVPLSPPLLVDIASTADGRAVALLESGNCALSSDAGATYQPLALPAPEHAVSVSSAGDALLVSLASGSVMRLEKGKPPWVESAPPAPPKRARADASWPLSEAPIERALRFGVPLGEEFAGVAVAGAVATVNLRTGELVQMTRALVPNDLDCRTLDANGGLLLVCTSPRRGWIVLSDVFGERPITQGQFLPDVRLAFAAGVLLAESRCDGEVRPGALCLRGADMLFHDFDVSAKLTALAQGAPAPAPALETKGTKTKGANSLPAAIAVSRFIPKEGGGALAVVTGPVSGLLDVQSGAFVPLAPEVESAVEHGMRPGLELNWVALADGSVRGWDGSTSVAITRDGHLEPSVYEYRGLGAAGAHALAFDYSRRAFQTADWGRTWVETLAPPGSSSNYVSVVEPHCSAVGCHLGPWLRVGWEPAVPGALSRAQVVPAPVVVARAPLPLLDCKERAAAVVAEVASVATETDDSTHGVKFGATDGPIAPGELMRGFLSWSIARPVFDDQRPWGMRGGLVVQLPSPLPEVERPPSSWSGYAKSKIFSFVPAFDANARLRSARVTWRSFFDVAALAGAPAPALDPGSDEAALIRAIPVAGRQAGQSEGLVLDDDTPVWAHDSGSPEPFSLGAGADELSVVSAVASAPHTLALLVASADGESDVREVTAGKARRLFQIPSLSAALYPENVDALAIKADGALAVLRTRSGGEPASAAEPAILLDERGAATVLAPWSRVFSADAPECKAQPNDYRAVLQTRRAWLQLVVSGVPVGEEERDAGMIALLRVNPDRICLEAVELAQGSIRRTDDEVAARVTVSFVGPGKGAAKLGFARGFALRQPLVCALSAFR